MEIVLHSHLQGLLWCFLSVGLPPPSLSSHCRVSLGPQLIRSDGGCGMNLSFWKAPVGRAVTSLVFLLLIFIYSLYSRVWAPWTSEETRSLFPGSSGYQLRSVWGWFMVVKILFRAWHCQHFHLLGLVLCPPGLFCSSSPFYKFLCESLDIRTSQPNPSSRASELNMSKGK